MRKPPPSYKSDSVPENAVHNNSEIEDVLFTVYGNNIKRPQELEQENTDEVIKELPDNIDEREDEKDEEYDVAKDYEAFFSSEEDVAAVIPVADETRLMDIVKEEAPVFDDGEPYKPGELSEIEAKKAKSRALKKKKEAAAKRRQRRNNELLRTFTHIFGSVLLIVFILSVSAFLAQFIVRATLDFMGITTDDFEYTVDIPEGALTEEIAEILSRYELISMPEFFIFYSRISEKDGAYLHGLFTINSTMSYGQIISTLQTRPRFTDTVDVTIVDGMTAREVGLLLEENLVCKAEDFEKFYMNKMNVYTFEKRVLQNSNKFYQLEGYLFPDSYNFYVIDDLLDNPDMDTMRYAELAARTIYSNYNSKVTNEMYKKMGEMGFTLDEFMTLASMVQWEAADPDDMKLVASVFLNRLNDPDNFPRMESNVTRKYATENIRPFINAGNTGIYTPILQLYDTYLSSGLPPGPVCSPGMNAMEAVLNAPSSGYYYFCANIETGEVFFAQTLREHEINLERAGIDISTVVN
ncbi:MAG: endolytic transglycosylase MltG [Oscillospiraceae bacterium]|nr:endolytic transglycosylase MltG [Oscillospiraceae bacterium]